MSSEVSLSLIASLKHPDCRYAIDICTDGVLLGRLRPINRKTAENPRLHELICRWRAENMQSFLTRFDPSPAKAADYLRNFSLPDPRRLLFMIETSEGQPIGHMGLCSITPKQAELDNVLRGDAAPDPRLIGLAARALLNWAFESLGIGKVTLSVLSVNDRALKFYQRLGFRTLEIMALRSEVTPGGTVLRPVPPEEANTVERLHYLALQPAQLSWDAS